MSSAFNIPAGYKLVPLEPNAAMEEAGEAAFFASAQRSRAHWAAICGDAYRAMLAVAPPATFNVAVVTPAMVEAVRLHLDIRAGEDAPIDIEALLREALAAAPTPPIDAVPGEPVAWRHSKTHCLYETEEDVELADGDEWAEPLYLAASVASRAGMEPAPVEVSRLAEDDFQRIRNALIDAHDQFTEDDLHVKADEMNLAISALATMASTPASGVAPMLTDDVIGAMLSRSTIMDRTRAIRMVRDVLAGHAVSEAGDTWGRVVEEATAIAHGRGIGDLLSAVKAFAATASAATDASEVPADASDPYFGVQDEVYLTRAVSVMNDVLTDISGWEDRALAEAVESSKVDLCAMIECIRMRADDNYVPGSKPIDGETPPMPRPSRVEPLKAYIREVVAKNIHARDALCTMVDDLVAAPEVPAASQESPDVPLLTPDQLNNIWRQWTNKSPSSDWRALVRFTEEVVRAALAAAQAAPVAKGAETAQEGSPDDVLTVAHIESQDGAGTLTLELSQLGDLASMVGEDAATYTVRIAGMKRAEFDALGDFDGF